MPARLAPTERRDKQRRAWLLRQQFWTQERIAEELGVTQSTVSAMLQREAKRQGEIFEKKALEIKAAQTAQLEQVAIEAFQAWRRSLEDSEQSRTKAIRAPAPEKGNLLPNLGVTADAEVPEEESWAAAIEPPLLDIEVVSTSRGQSGNPALLAQVREALADIREIWGINAPQKQDVGLTVLVRLVNELRSLPQEDLLDVLGYATDALPESTEA